MRAAAGGRRGGARHAPDAAAGRCATDHDRDAGAERRGGPCAAGRGDDHMTPILFIDSDGTLIEEPAAYQIDACDKLRLVAGLDPALLGLRTAGSQFVDFITT